MRWGVHKRGRGWNGASCDDDNVNASPDYQVVGMYVILYLTSENILMARDETWTETETREDSQGLGEV